MGDVEDLRKGFFFIGLAAVQFGVQPYLIRWFAQEALTSVIVLASEIAKIILCTGILFFSGQLYSQLKALTFWNSFKTAGIPATIYAVINILYQISYKNLDGVMFNFLNQTKLFWCSVFLWIFLKKPQGEEQVVALVMLTVSAIMLTWDKIADNEIVVIPENSPIKRYIMEGERNSFLYGFLPVLTGSILSGVATTVSQKVLQNDNKNSYLYTAELGVWGIITLLIFSFGELDSISQYGIFKGWSILTIIPVVTSGLGGIFVGLVVKYAGGVRKGFGTVAGMLLTAVLGYFFDDSPFTTGTWISLPLLVISVYVHTSYPYKAEPTLPTYQKEYK